MVYGCETCSLTLKGERTQDKDISKQDTEANIWAQNGRDCREENDSQRGTS